MHSGGLETSEKRICFPVKRTRLATQINTERAGRGRHGPPPSAVSNRNWQEQKAPENLSRNRGCSRVTCSSQRHSVTTQAPDAKQKKKKVKRETGGTAGEHEAAATSVPESFLRQSVSTTVCSAAGEKHFRGGKRQQDGGRAYI